MVWLPTAKAEVVNVATPPLKVTAPIELPPSRKVTVPVGVPAPGNTGETVAVKVTGCPNTDGFGDEVKVVLVSALLTTWGFPLNEPVLPLKLVLALYDVVMVWLPTVKAEVVKLATPPLKVTVPIELPPSRKVTVPPGVPAPGDAAETVAVKVTGCPKTDGLTDELTAVVVLDLLFVRLKDADVATIAVALTL
jgi:hypothetical protein